MGEHSKRKSGGKDSFKAAKKPKTAAAAEELSSSAQKRQLRKERQSHRRHADTVAEAKALWNKLRLKSNTPDDTKALMEQVMTLIRGKVNEIALQHDASRVVQAAVQFGNDEQRKELLQEICADSAAGLAELSKIQYAHFLCLKFIKYCARDPECVKTIVKVSGGCFAQKLQRNFPTRTCPDPFSCSKIHLELQGLHPKACSTLGWCTSGRVSVFEFPRQVDHVVETGGVWTALQSLRAGLENNTHFEKQPGIGYDGYPKGRCNQVR